MFFPDTAGPTSAGSVCVGSDGSMTIDNGKLKIDNCPLSIINCQLLVRRRMFGLRSVGSHEVKELGEFAPARDIRYARSGG